MGIEAKKTIYIGLASLLFAALGSVPLEAHSKKPKVNQRIKAYEKQLSKDAEKIDVRERLAALYNKTKQPQKTVDTLAPYSNEASAKGLVVLANAYEALNDNLNEVRTLKFLLEKEPNRFRPHFLLGQAYERNKQVKEAIDHYRKSVGFAKKHLPSYDAMLRIFRDQSNYYEARLLVQDKIRNVGERKEFFNELCELYEKGGFLKEGVKICQRAIKMDPKHPQNHVYLARSYANQQKKEVAKRVFTNAAKRFKKSEFVLWSAGEFFYQQTNYPAAVRYLQQAVKADSSSARAQLGLAISLFEISSYEKAMKSYLNSCKYDETKESLMAYRTAIARLRQEDKWQWANKFTQKEHLCKVAKK